MQRSEPRSFELYLKMCPLMIGSCNWRYATIGVWKVNCYRAIFYDQLLLRNSTRADTDSLPILKHLSRDFCHCNVEKYI